VLCLYLDSVAGIGQTPESQSAREDNSFWPSRCTDAPPGKPYFCNLQPTLLTGLIVSNGARSSAEKTAEMSPIAW
jgi:hypothetical protein